MKIIYRVENKNSSGNWVEFLNFDSLEDAKTGIVSANKALPHIKSYRITKVIEYIIEKIREDAAHKRGQLLRRAVAHLRSVPGGVDDLIDDILNEIG